MFTNKDKSKSNTFTFTLFDSKNKSHREELNSILDNEIKRRDIENEPMAPTHEKMVDWLKTYVNSKEFMDLYHDKRTLELMAEATFWTVKLGLESHLAKMTYKEIRQFKPLEEGYSKSERANLINKVCDKLVKPAWSFEASFALGQAAWCVYAHKNSYKKLLEEQKIYESKNETQLNIDGGSSNASTNIDDSSDDVKKLSM